MLKYLFLMPLFCLVTPTVSPGQVYNPEPEESPELKILSWNIHMLPYFVYRKTKKRVRAKGIIEELNKSDYNVIVFQEAFHQIVRRKLRKGLKKKYPYHYGPANKKFLSLKANSGIWILSDRPMIYVDEIRYEHATGDGKLARKGVLMVEGEWYGQRYQLLGTHNNGGWINNSQFHELRYKLLDRYRIEGVPQIICGDYNTKETSKDDQWNSMLRLFDADTSYIQYDDRADDHKASMPAETVYKRFPDFIFIRRNNNTALKVLRCSTISMGPTWKQAKKKVYLETVGLSDHYPVQITLKWQHF